MLNKLAVVLCAAGFGALILSFAISERAISFYAPPPHDSEQHTSSPDKAAGEDCKADPNKSFWEKTACDPMAYFTLWLMGFTGVLAAGTLALWWVTWRASVRQTKETHILQRAYISAELGGINQWRTAANQFSCDFSFLNSGNLPATEVGWALRRKFSDVRLLNDFEDIRREPFVGEHVIIPAHGAMTKSALPLPASELAKGVAKFPGKPVYLYIYGRVRYTDGLNHVRIIGFCHRYNVNDVGPEGVPTKYGRQHEYGNYTEQ